MSEPYKVHVIVEKGGIQVAEMVTEVSGGRHEFTFLEPIKVPSENGFNRHFEGFALEMHLDQETRRVTYNEHLAKRVFADFKR